MSVQYNGKTLYVNSLWKTEEAFNADANKPADAVWGENAFQNYKAAFNEAQDGDTIRVTGNLGYIHPVNGRTDIGSYTNPALDVNVVYDNAQIDNTGLPYRIDNGSTATLIGGSDLQTADTQIRGTLNIGSKDGGTAEVTMAQFNLYGEDNAKDCGGKDPINTAVINVYAGSKLTVNADAGDMSPKYIGKSTTRNGLLNVEGGTFTAKNLDVNAGSAVNISDGGSFTVKNTLKNNGTIKVTGDSVLQIKEVTGKEINLAGSLTNSNVGGHILVNGNSSIKADDDENTVDITTVSGTVKVVNGSTLTVEEGAELKDNYLIVGDAVYGFDFLDYGAGQEKVGGNLIVEGKVTTNAYFNAASNGKITIADGGVVDTTAVTLEKAGITDETAKAGTLTLEDGGTLKTANFGVYGGAVANIDGTLDLKLQSPMMVVSGAGSTVNVTGNIDLIQNENLGSHNALTLSDGAKFNVNGGNVDFVVDGNGYSNLDINSAELKVTGNGTFKGENVNLNDADAKLTVAGGNFTADSVANSGTITATDANITADTLTNEGTLTLVGGTIDADVVKGSKILYVNAGKNQDGTPVVSTLNIDSLEQHIYANTANEGTVVLSGNVNTAKDIRANGDTVVNNMQVNGDYEGCILSGTGRFLVMGETEFTGNTVMNLNTFKANNSGLIDGDVVISTANFQSLDYGIDGTKDIAVTFTIKGTVNAATFVVNSGFYSPATNDKERDKMVIDAGGLLHGYSPYTGVQSGRFDIQSGDMIVYGSVDGEWRATGGDSYIGNNTSDLDATLTVDGTYAAADNNNGKFINVGDQQLIVGEHGTVNVINGGLFRWDNAVTNDGTITMDTKSLITAGSITGTGTITVDAKGFSGFKKMIDLADNATAVDVAIKNNTKAYVVKNGGDTYVTTADKSSFLLTADVNGDGEADKFGDVSADGKFIAGVNAFDSAADAINAMSAATKTIYVDGEINGTWPGQVWEGTEAFKYALNFQKAEGAASAVINAYADAQNYSYRFAHDLTVGKDVTLKLYDDVDNNVHYDNQIDFAPAGAKVTVTVDGTLIYSTANFGAGAKDESGMYIADMDKTVYINVTETGKMFATGEGNVTFFENSVLTVKGTGKENLQFTTGSYTQFGGKVDLQDTCIRIWGTTSATLSENVWMGLGNYTFAGDGVFTAANSRIEVVDGILTYEQAKEAPASNAGLPETKFEDLNRNVVYFDKTSNLTNTDIYAGDMYVMGKTITMNGGILDLAADVGQTQNGPNPLETSGDLTIAAGATLAMTNAALDAEGTIANSGTITATNANITAGTVTNNGDFTVKGTSTLNIDKLTGTAINLYGTLDKSNITGNVRIVGDAAVIKNSTVAGTVSDSNIGTKALTIDNSNLNGLLVGWYGQSYKQNYTFKGNSTINGAAQFFSDTHFKIADAASLEITKGDLLYYSKSFTVSGDNSVLTSKGNNYTCIGGNTANCNTVMTIEKNAEMNIGSTYFWVGYNVYERQNGSAKLQINSGATANVTSSVIWLSENGSIEVNSATLNVSKVNGDKLEILEIKNKNNNQGGNLNISGTSTVYAQVDDCVTVTLAKNAVLAGDLTATITVAGTASLAAGAAFAGSITSGTLKVSGDNDLNLTDSAAATLLVAAGDYSDDTFGAVAIKGATKNAELTLSAAALNGNKITNAKVNFTDAGTAADVDINASVALSDIKSINDNAVKSINGVYFYEVVTKDDEATPDVNEAKVDTYILNKVDDGIDIVEAVAGSEDADFFKEDMGNFTLTGDLAAFDVTMKSGNTTLKVANGESAAIGSIEKNVNGGVNNVSVGNGSGLTVDTIERMGNITVGKNGSEMVVNEDLTGTSAAETIAIGDNSDFESKGIDFATGKATFKLGKNADATVDGDFTVDGANNTITLGADAGMNITGNIINNCGDNYDYANGKVLYAPAFGTTINLGKGAVMLVGKYDDVNDITTDIIGLAGLTLASGSAAKFDKNGNEIAEEVNTIFAAGDVYGTEKNNTINVGNFGIFTADSIDMFDGNDTIKTGSDSDFVVATFDQNGNKDHADIVNVETISIGARSGFAAEDIIGVNKLTTGNGSYDKKTGIATYTVLGTEGFIKGTAKNDTISLGNWNSAVIQGGIDMLDGNDTLKLGSDSILFAGNYPQGAGNMVLADIANVETISIGARSIFAAEDIIGVNKLTAANGVKDDTTQILATGTVTGTAKNDTISLGNWSAAQFGKINLGAGNNTIKIGNDSYLYAGAIYIGDDTSASTLSIGANVNFTASSLVWVNKLTVGNGTTFAIGSIAGSRKNDTITFGNNNTVTVKSISLQEGNDTIKIGNDSTVTVSDPVSNYGIIYGAETINIGSRSSLIAGTTISGGLKKLTAANGSYDKKTGTTNWTEVETNSMLTGYGNDSITFGNYNKVDIGELRLLAGNDTLKIGNDSVADFGKVDLDSGNDIFNIGDRTTVTATNTIKLGNDNDTFKIGNDSTVIVEGDLNFGTGKDTMTIGKNSVVKFESINMYGSDDTINASKGAELWFDNGAAEADLTGAKGSWKNATIYDMQGEITLTGGGSVYANEWDVYDLNGHTLSAITVTPNSNVKVEVWDAAIEDWTIYDGGVYSGSMIRIGVAADTFDKKDQYDKEKYTFNATLA